jgi:AGZA family xanthine/uracil permease-like MFS transporter
MGLWAAGYEGWQLALAITAIAGAIFLLLSFTGFRANVLSAIPDALKSGIAAGIGLLIARVGVDHSNLAAGMGAGALGGFYDNPAAWVALVGIAVTLALLAFRVRGAILIGILAATGLALYLGETQWRFPLAVPGGVGETAGGFLHGLRGLGAALTGGHAVELLVFIAVLLMMDLFDTVGTLVGVASQAGLMRDGQLPKAQRALAADAAGTVIGGCLGSSTVTSYVESVTGVQAGARTGLAAIVTGGMMLLAMFCGPLVAMVMGEFDVAGRDVFPTISAALIIVGAMMLRAVRQLDWDDPTEYLPAFLTIILMPLTLSIADGIAAGFIAYAFAKLVSGRPRHCPALVYIFAVLFVLRYALGAVG